MSVSVEEDARVKITDPGVYQGLDEATYHADPVDGGSLSVSGAKKLLACPARFNWERSNPPDPKPEFLIGHAAHALVLGVGAEIVEVKEDSWRKTSAQEAQKEAIAEGKTPLLTKDLKMVHAMAAALRAKQIPNLLLSGNGQPEASLFLRDRTGVMLRGRVDWLPEPTDRMIVADYKTANSADPAQFAKPAADYGYHQQDAWYSDLITGLGLAAEVAFLFVVQEKTPPYEVSIMQLDSTDRDIGRYQNRRAIDLYIECSKSGVWPGYGDEVHVVELPGWFRNRFAGLEEAF